MDLTKLDIRDWDNIYLGMTGNRADHPIFVSLSKAGAVLDPGVATCSEVRWACQAIHWEARADEFAMQAKVARVERQKQEKYTQALFSENEQLRDVLRFAQEEIEDGGSNTTPILDVLRKKN